MTLAATAAEQFVHQIGTGTVVHNSGACHDNPFVWLLELSASVEYVSCVARHLCAATAQAPNSLAPAGELFSDHLVSVQRVLEGWHVGKELELAGLYHNIYGAKPLLLEVLWVNTYLPFQCRSAAATTLRVSRPRVMAAAARRH